MTQCNWQSCACPLAQKVVLPKEVKISWTVTGYLFNKKIANCCISRHLSDGKDTDMSTVSQYSPKNKVQSEMKSICGKKLICYPRQTKKRAQKDSFPLACILCMIQDQDIIQIHFKMKMPPSAKEQRGFNK